MIDTLFSSLLDYSALGLFAIYLIWQGIINGKKADKMIQDFRDEIDKMRDTRREEIEALRARYDSVIEDLNKHRDKLRDGIESKSKATLGKLNTIQSHLDLVLTSISEMKQEEKLRRIAATTPKPSED